MENLIDTLEQESVLYEELLVLSQKKTQIIVSGDIEALTKITDEEQLVVDKIGTLENKRETVTKDIADVLNRDLESMKLTNLIELLAKQPKEQKKLSDGMKKANEDLEKQKRETAKNTLITVFNSGTNKSRSLVLDTDQVYKAYISEFVNAFIPVWIQYRDTLFKI